MIGTMSAATFCVTAIVSWVVGSKGGNGTGLWKEE